MNKNRVTKFLSILLTMCMLLGMLPMTALADNFSDIKGHWAESQINEMINEGIVKGYPDGSFKPDGDISRAEFVSLIVKAFKLTKAKGKDFDDISNHWAKDAILTANAHGIVNGYSDTKFGPDDPITREQMAVIIVKVAHLTDNSKGKTFVDSQDISEWAKKAVAIASSNQLITGYPDNTFKPSGNASRAEATAVLSKSLTIVNLPVEIDYSSIENSGKYGPETGNEIIESDVIIKAKDVILQNLIIKGDLIISKEVGDGDATLNNVKVEGKTYIRGGGIDSIHINQGEYREIIIERTITGAVRILTANVQRISITISENDNGEDVILNGEIKTVTIKADGIKVISQGETTIDKIEVTRGLKDVKIELTEDTEVKEIILDSKVDVKGKGEIEKASGSKIRESTFVTAPKRIITPSTGGNGSSSSGGSGSGGTSTTPTIKVSAISISGEAVVGKELTATANTEHVNYQWLRADTEDGTYTEISGATGNTYTLDDADRDKYIKVKVTGKSGLATGDMTSDPTVQVKLVNAEIGPASGTFYHNDEGDITATITWNSATKITKIITSGVELVENADYIVAGDTLTIKKEYFKKDPVSSGGTGFGVEFDRGSTVSLTVNIATKYQVVFDANGGSGAMDNDTATNDQNFTFPSNGFTAPEGKVFEKWKVKKDGYDEYYAEGATKQFLDGHVESDGKTIKIYAFWEDIPKYVVTFSVVNGNGSISATVDDISIASGDEVEEGSKVIFTATPDAGYKVKEWKQNGDTLPGTDSTLPVMGLAFAINMTVEFEATAEKYTVTYDENGGTGTAPIDAIQYAANAEVTVEGEGSLEKTHYLFDGWNTQADGSGIAYAENDTFKITANTTLYAQWTPVITSIVIKESPTKYEYVDLEKLDLTGLVVTVHYAKGDTADIPFVDFEANYISTTYAHGHPVTKTEHQTLNVGWKGNKDVVANVADYKVYYRVTFDAQGGTVSPADALTKGESGVHLLSLPTPTKTGFTFDGWFTEQTSGEEVGVDYQFTKNTTIYAQWTEVVTPVAVTGVSLNESTMSLTVGAEGTLTATVTPEDAANKNVSWSSSDETVATVDATGKVTAVAAGTATITVTTVDGGFTATCAVTVSAASVAVTGVSLDQTAMNLTAGGATGTLTATVAPVGATNKNVTWTSSDTGVATVVNGVVTPVAAGNAIITVTTEDGSKTATCTVTVTAATVAVTGVSLDQTTMNLTAGGATGTLTATVTPEDAANKNVSWSSSDETVATVDATGKVTAVAAGTATITVTTVDGGFTATCAVTVSAASDKIVTLKNIPGITIPAKDGVPVTAVGANDQYTGTVAWSPSVTDNKFGLGQIYTATIVLTAKTGYTLEGITDANFFSVVGANTVNYASGSKTVTVTFPTTGTLPAQTGSPSVTAAPVYGNTLMAQSGTLGTTFGGLTYTWYRSEDANFDVSDLKLTPKTENTYKIGLDDIGKYLILKAENENATGYGFLVIGPVVKANVVDTVAGSISAYYLSDGKALYIRGINSGQGELEAAVAIDGTNYDAYQVIGTDITEKDITGLLGVNASTKVKIRKAETSTHYASSEKEIENYYVRHKLTLQGEGLVVDKTPDVFGDHKTYADNEYLKLTVTPPTGNVIDSLKIGVEEKRDSLNGNNELWFNIKADTTITVTYTTIQKVDIAAIEGVTPPVAGYTPVTSIMETAQYTGTISWNPGHDTFGKDQIYTATITLEAKHPFSFDGVASDFFTVAGATLVTNDANSGVVKATFPKTGAEQVSLLEIHDHQVVKPQKGYAIKADPFTSYGGTYVEYDGTTVRWYEEGNETEVSGYFEANTVYIAKVNLEAKEGYTFAGLSSNSFGYGGTSTSVTFTIDPNDSKKGLVTITFPATEKDQVEEPVITVSETHPSNRKDDVTLTVTPVEGVTYYYTLDESDPSNSSTRIEYKGVATLPAPDNDEQVNMLIKVIGVRDGYIDSEIATKTVYYQPVVNVGVESYIAKDRADEIYVDLSIMNVELEKENFTVNKNGSAYTDFSVAKQGNGFDYILTLGQDAQATDVFTLTIDKLGYRFNGGSAVENRLGVYKLTYDANYADSGTVPEDNGMYDDGESVTILGNTGSLVKANHSFEGWNTKADGSGTNYKENDSFTITGNTMLYANWKAIGIKVDGVEVPLTNGPLSTDENSNLNKLSWDFATKTLTMDGFIGETMSTIGFKDDIVIELSGDNKLTNQADEGPSLSLWSSLEIKGNGKLEIKGKNVGVSHGSWSPLTIKDSATLIIDNSYNSSGNMSGISNCQNLTVEDAAKLEVKLEYQGQYGVAVTGVDANIINNSSQPIEITVYNRLAGGATVSTEMPSLHNGSKGLAYQGEVALASGKGTTTDPIEISYKIYSTTTLKANDIRLGKISIEEIWSDNFDGTLIAADEPISLTDPIYVKSNGKYYKISIEKDASKINIGGTEYSLDSSFNVPGLSWDNNSNTLIMDGYNDGAYIHGYIQQTALLTEITINVVGENSITADGMEALLFDKLSIIGDDKANDKLSVTVTGDKSRAVYYNSSIKDVTLKIDADLGDSYNQNRGIHGNMLVDNGHLEIVARKDNTGTNTIYGVSERLTFASGGSADIELTDKQGSRVSVALNMPSIGSYDNNSGYLVNGAWYGKLTVDTDKDGSSTEKARELVYKVSQATADALTFEHIAVSGGSPAITYTWDSASWSVYNSESFEEGNQITAETMEATKLFTEAISEGDKKIITVKDDKNGKYYKITIEVENQPVEP